MTDAPIHPQLYIHPFPLPLPSVLQHWKEEQKRSKMADDNFGNFGFESCRVQLHAIFAFIIATLLSLAQVKYQSPAKVSPFEQHKYLVPTFIISLSAYAAASLASAKLQPPNRSITTALKAINSLQGLASGVAVASLVFLLVPILGWIIFVLCATFLVSEGYKFRQELLEMLCWAIRMVEDLWKQLIDTVGGLLN